MTVKFQAFHSIKAINNREVLFNWSRTNPLGALDQVWRPTHSDELQALGESLLILSADQTETVRSPMARI